MAGSNTLPAGTEPIAAVVLVYSTIGWLCTVTMIWLTWIHRQRFSYVAMIAYFTLLGTTMSITQQCHDYINWEEIMIKQWELVSKFPDSPEMATAQGSQGLDLILFYIQFYTYNASALCVLFWAGELAQTLYGFDAKPRLKRVCRKINQAGRGVAIILPLFTTLMLRLPEVRAHILSFLLVADLPLMLSMTLGSLMVMLILIRYLVTQKKFTQWSMPRTDQSGSDRGTEAGLSYASTSSSKRIGIQKIRSKQGGIYDRWLMIRFFLSFIMLAVFDVTTVLFQLNALNANRKDGILPAPDMSAERAQTTLLGFLPGVTPGIMLFLVFGTTAGHRRKIYEALVPKRWQKPVGERFELSALFKSRKRRAIDSASPSTRKWPWADRGVQRVPSYAMSPRAAMATPAVPLGPVRHKKGGQSVDIMSMLTKETLADLQKPLPPYPSSAAERYSFDTPGTGASSQPASIREARVEQVVWRTSVHDPASRPVHISHQARRGSYYTADPEQSDESGPTLPIMQNDKRDSRT
ncbi:uncharacterized protein B0I36DRAFT_334181 [Microdochium trichocladiopsis]|uniref:Glycoside hydrolase protein n=1 Tax=Microdochium trichocladiopsis TaxID=1682393 RepID=A0A9P9BKJ6_9PEZI|nr:uncharacterized protein B0I36DRAFT_334181 [Microdochium trichocladiopsis]KAH7021281.1 hypothetical protein B0I36DRAFT_334181 [Microdochium trichocladiopsis]